MTATTTPKTITRDLLPRIAAQTTEKAAQKTSSRPGLLTILLRALSAFAV